MVAAVQERRRRFRPPLVQPTEKVGGGVLVCGEVHAGAVRDSRHTGILWVGPGANMRVMSDEGEPKPRGRPRSEQAHQRILEATSTLLSQTSYEAVTVERIAAEAGVGKQTIYRWWPNKASVVLEAVLSGYADLQLVPMPDTGDLSADLHAWMRGMITEGFRAQNVSMARSLLVAGLEGLPDTAELLEQERLWDAGALVSRLRKAAERGEMRADTHLASVISALTDPLVFNIITGQTCTEEWGAGLIDLVLEGISGPTPASHHQ